MLGGSAVHFSLAASFFTEVRRRSGRSATTSATSSSTVLREPRRRRPTTSSASRAARPSSGAATTSTTSTSPTPTTPSSTSSATSSRSSPTRSRGGRRRSSSPTSSPTCSARCAPSATARSFAALDSMNLWIETARDSLLAAIGEVDCLILNDAEIRHADRASRTWPAPRRAVMELGPRDRRRQAGRVRRGAVHRRRLLRPARASRSRTCATRPAPATASPAASSATSTAPGGELDDADAAAGDGLRHRARLLQRRGVRHRARRPPEPRGDRRALRGAAAR